METESRLRMAEVFVGIRDPRQAKKVEHSLVELLVVAVCGVLAGADDFVQIEEWAKEKLEWFRQYLKLENGIPSHDTFGRVFAVIDAEEFGAAFRRWVRHVVPALDCDEVVGIDGKTSRRSGKVDATPLHLVSAFAAGANVVLGQRATAEKSNEKNRDFRTVGDTGAGGLRRDHRRHGHTAEYCPGHPGSRCRVHPVGQGQPTETDRLDAGLLCRVFSCPRADPASIR